MIRWLLGHGFVEQIGKATSHRQFVKDGTKITLAGHGPQDLTKKHVGIILRQLKLAGFDPEQVKQEL